MKKNDLILIAAALVISIGLILGMQIYKKFATEGDAYVLVTIDGEEYARFSLSEDYFETISFFDGEYNLLQIKDGEVEMIEASCPDQICVRHSNIKYTGESIVCLPHKLVVEIINGEEAELDGATH